MDYIDARCPRCQSWQTTLVGYGGVRICLGCGEPVGEVGASTAVRAFEGVGWTSDPWARRADLAPELRRARLRAWLRHHQIGLADELVDLLAHCETASEVRFALPIVTLSAWRVVSERTVTDGIWGLRVQHPIGTERVDFVLTGPELRPAVVIEIDGPEHDLPEQRRRDELRTLELRAQGYLVMRVPADRAEEQGIVFRKAFYREQLTRIEQRLPAPPGGAPATAVTRPRRTWHPHELVYDTHDEPLDRRRELVEDWLRSRGVVLEGWQYDFLAHCHRAGEVHFAVPLLRLPNAEPVDERTIHLDPWHTLRAQAEVGDHTADFLFMTVLEEAQTVVSTLIDILPARGPRDPEAERARRQRWEREGVHVVEIPAAEARGRGEEWAQRLLREIAWRRERDAG